MPLWIMLLLALAITIGACLLLFGGQLLIGMVLAGPIYLVIPLPLIAAIFLIALGILWLPSEWRVWAAVVATPLVVGTYFWILSNHRLPE